MALYVATQTNYPHGEKREVIWHVGEAKPFGADEVYGIYADGDELEHILYYFENIPKRLGKKTSMTWRNDIAKFIWENL